MKITGSKLRKNQNGMVSILVTMVIMIIISLIVIGFARIARREQQQALDRQLSAQAFYAAETGINDAVNALKNAGYSSEKTNCGPDGTGPLSTSQANNVLDADAGVAYTCLLIDPTPLSLDYSSVSIEEATVIPLWPVSGRLDTITFSWQDRTGSTAFGGCPAPSGGQYTFPAAASWPSTCNAGIVRIDLVPRDTTLSRDAMMSRTLTAFLYPQNSGSTAPSSYTHNVSNPNKGMVIPANCNAGSTPRKCNVDMRIVGDGGVAGYYLRVRSIYRTSSLNIVGKNSSNVRLELQNAQALVDATGKASDILRRIVVRVPMTNIGNGVPSYAVQSFDSVCKRFGVAPNVPPTPADGDPACQIN